MQWHLETRKISELKDHPRNPRTLSKNDAEQLKRSLNKFGTIEKIIINKDGTIIGGHQRKSILKSMNKKEVECWVPETALTQSEVDELCIRLNRNTGDWDYDILANQWDMDSLTDWGFVLSDLTNDIYDDKIAEMECDESIIDGCDIMAKFIITIPKDDSTSLHNQLTELVAKFPLAKMEHKV